MPIKTLHFTKSVLDSLNAQRRKDRAAKKAAGIATQKKAVTEEQKDANNAKQRKKRAAKKAAGIATQKRVGQKKRTAEKKDAQNAQRRKDRADAQKAKKRRKLDEDDAQVAAAAFFEDDEDSSEIEGLTTDAERYEEVKTRVRQEAKLEEMAK